VSWTVHYAPTLASVKFDASTGQLNAAIVDWARFAVQASCTKWIATNIGKVIETI